MNRNKLSVGELNGRNGYGQLFSWPDALVSKCRHFLEIWSAILVIGIEKGHMELEAVPISFRCNGRADCSEELKIVLLLIGSESF